MISGLKTFKNRLFSGSGNTEPENTENGTADTLEPARKAWLVIAGMLFFLLFTVILFPYEELARYYLSGLPDKSLSIGFNSFQIPVFGKKRVNSFSVNYNTFRFSSEELLTDASLIRLARGSFIGELRAEAVKIETDKITMKLNTLFSNNELDNVTSPEPLKGNVMLNISGGALERLPEIPVIGLLENVQINNSVFKLDINGRNINISNSYLNTSIARLNISGSMVLNPVFRNSPINFSICPVITSSFRVERPDIVSMLELLPKNPKGEICIPVSGTFGAPNIQMNMFSQTNTPTTAVPPPVTSSPVTAPSVSKRSSAPESTEIKAKPVVVEKTKQQTQMPDPNSFGGRMNASREMMQKSKR